jgi:cytochrome c553
MQRRREWWTGCLPGRASSVSAPTDAADGGIWGPRAWKSFRERLGARHSGRADGGCREPCLPRRFALAVTILCLLPFRAALAQGTPQAPDTMEARVAGCAPCHGARGEGTSNDYFPRLTGKPAGYSFNQLLAFREGRRRYAPMNYLLEFLTPDYLRKMAEFYAEQRPPPQAITIPTTPPAVNALGDAAERVFSVSRSTSAKIASCIGLASGRPKNRRTSSGVQSTSTVIVIFIFLSSQCSWFWFALPAQVGDVGHGYPEPCAPTPFFPRPGRAPLPPGCVPSTQGRGYCGRCSPLWRLCCGPSLLI